MTIFDTLNTMPATIQGIVGTTVDYSTSIYTYTDTWAGPIKTTEQVARETAKDEIHKVMADQDLVLVKKSELTELNQSLESLKEGYMLLHKVLIGKDANGLADALEGLLDLIKDKTADEVLMNRAKEEAKEELGKISDRI